MGRAIDVLITYRIIKMLITPFEKQDAYKYGIIDKNGKQARMRPHQVYYLKRVKI